MNDTVAVGTRHLVRDAKLAVSCLAPVLLGLKDVNTALRVSGIELYIFSYFLVEAGQPDIVRQL